MVHGLTDINIESSVDNVSAVTMKFYGIIDGLDNIQETYQFETPKRPYKPNRNMEVASPFANGFLLCLLTAYRH